MNGWFFEVYPHPESGVVAWLMGENGERQAFRQNFPLTGYAAGPPERLAALAVFLQRQPRPADLERTHRRDLFSGMLDVLAITTPETADFAPLLSLAQNRFPDLAWYDTDLPLPLRYAACYGVFPLARVAASAQDGWLKRVTPLDSPWDLDPDPPPLRTLAIRPNCDPQRRPPGWLWVQAGQKRWRLPIEPVERLLIWLGALLRRCDPDLILSHYGDTWLFPLLAAYVRQHNVQHFNPNRDPTMPILQREEMSYFTYGQTVYRGAQTHLYGRWHIDECNAMMYGDYGLEGVLEAARVSGQPVQEAARKSPGAGITALQIIAALQNDILVPCEKQQVEAFKTAQEFITADRGGLVYQPIPGLHQDVAEIDFVSMYPSIMVHFNLSPETVGVQSPQAARVPELNMPVDVSVEGFVPLSLRPLLNKRIQIKRQLATLHRRDCRYAPLKARAAALKWLLVVCFGYLGYKNARFGRIESHEAVTAYGRECMLRAKEAAEAQGYRVLHMYVDGLWVQKPGVTPASVQPLLAEITAVTGLPIALEGVYRWIAFLSSRLDERMAVANRYFGVFQDGSLKYRGIAARRKDTPPWVAEAQLEILDALAHSPQTTTCPPRLPEVERILARRLQTLEKQQAPLRHLLVTQTLSRELDAYKVPSAAARAALQLRQAGKAVRPGQRIRYLFTRGQPGVTAWDLPPALHPPWIDTAQYRKLLLRAAEEVLQPIAAAPPDLFTESNPVGG